MKLLKNFLILLGALFFSLVAGASLLILETWRECEGADSPELSAAIIFGNEVSEQGEITPDLSLRLDKAVELYESGKAFLFILSGGNPNLSLAEHEAQAMKAYLVEKGLPEGHIVLQAKAGNAIDNIQFAKLLLDSLDCEMVFVVTSKPQLCRALLITEQSGIPSVGVAADVSGGFLRLCAATIAESFRLLYFLAVEQWQIPEELLIPQTDFQLRYTSL
ncbi:MAG: YdcF family protein [Chloroherpetonaceae bacterium]|nr:YdcF family protein [Chloroherpetonaceae bacterium]MDW8438525.1 YdcF family protein [Chloroherpetonaceae bacterium]